MNKKIKVEAYYSGNALNLNITGRIYQGDLAPIIRYRIDEALSNNISNLNVFISSEGGSVFEAEDVKNEFRRMPNRTCKVGALAASAATNILTVFDVVEAYSTSQFMIHKPMSVVQGNEDEVESDLKLLKNITNNYRTLYANKSGKTEDEIEQLWKNDYWMSAQEALEFKLITKIIDENLDYSEETLAMMTACGCPNIPEKHSTNLKQDMDINQVKSALGLPADATEEQIVAKAKEVKSKADNAAQIEASIAKQKQESAERVVNQAILDKKITTDLKATYVGLHMQDPVKTEEILSKMKGVNPASEFIDPKAEGGATGRENWELEDYLEKDPVAFEELIKTDPDKVRKLNAIYAQKK